MKLKKIKNPKRTILNLPGEAYCCGVNNDIINKPYYFLNKNGLREGLHHFKIDWVNLIGDNKFVAFESCKNGRTNGLLVKIDI